MFKIKKEIVLRYDLDEYIEKIVSELSDEEYQEIIDSVNNGYLSGVVKPEHIKKYLRNAIRETIILENIDN